VVVHREAPPDAPRARRAQVERAASPRRWDDFLASGFARWYRIEPSRDAEANIGRAVEHRVRGYAAARGLVVVLGSGDELVSIVATVARPVDGLAQLPFFVEFTTSLLRALEPDDTVVRSLTARLRAHIGLGTHDDDAAGVGPRDGADALADALLAGRADADVALASGAHVRVTSSDDAVEITWSRAAGGRPQSSGWPTAAASPTLES